MLHLHSPAPRWSEIPQPFDARAELAKLCAGQRRLLPQTAPQVPGYCLSLVYRPAYCVTGDYHDFFLQGPAGPAIFVGDGSGHGPAACMLMATMRALMRTHQGLHDDPGATLTTVDDLFCSLVPPDLFMTGVHLVLHRNGRVHWAAAGQDPPLRIDACGAIIPVDLNPVGLPLGVEPNETYATVAWQLGVGDRLLVYTDGIVEAQNRASEQFGRRRLHSCWSRLSGLPLNDAVAALVARVLEHLNGAALADDFTILGIERDATCTRSNSSSTEG